MPKRKVPLEYHLWHERQKEGRRKFTEAEFLIIAADRQKAKLRPGVRAKAEESVARLRSRGHGRERRKPREFGGRVLSG